MNGERSNRQAGVAYWAIAFTAALSAGTATGCRGRAHDDLYRQRMASEIRVLEDQLYEADYENRVLREQVADLRRRQHECEVTLESTRANTQPNEVRSRRSDRAGQPDNEETTSPAEDGDIDSQQSVPGELSEELPDDLSLPSLDEGEVVDPEALMDPEWLPPAPGGPEPPSKRDTELPDVEPGEILPPPATKDDEVKPPGQIKLPDTLAGTGNPQKIRIHTGLSGGESVDGQIEKVLVVVNALDERGQTVDLSDFDVDADLSVVALDPARDPSEARLGRWDFNRRQVSAFVRDNPTSGFHIPLTWQDVDFEGEEIIVHVRLRAEDDEMRCQGKVRLARVPGMAEWTPRGDQLR